MSTEVPALPRVKDHRALVAVDLGAESCRVSLLRWKEEQPFVELLHRFPNHAVERGDGLRWGLHAILEELDVGLRLCAERAPEGIRSIAVDGWAVDYVRLDETTGKAVDDPFCYRDKRSLVAQAELHARISAERMQHLTGVQILALNSVYQMVADSDADRRLRWLNLPEYVLYTLGARPVAELTNAVHTQMLSLNGTWSEEILEAAAIPLRSMPEIVRPGTEVGQLATALRELPAFAGGTSLIVPACHDTASAVAAIPDQGDDWAYISSGTWSLVGTLLDAPLVTQETCAANFTNLNGANGTTCFHRNVNGMWLLRQCMESWNRNAVDAVSLDSLVRAAGLCTPGADLLHVDDPDLLLSGGMPERINAQLLRRGLPAIDTSAEAAPVMAALIFRSLAARYAEVLRQVSVLTGKRFRRLYIMGGGSQNLFLNRLTEEATGISVIAAGTECSTRGNLAVQLASLEGTMGSRPAAVWASVLAAAE